MFGDRRKPIGFKQYSEKESKKERNLLQDIDAEYNDLVDAYDQEQNIISREVQLLQTIREELVHIHQLIIKLESDVREREKLYILITASQKNNPQEAANLVDQVYVLDGEIVKLSIDIQKDLEKHELSAIHEVYKDNKLGDKEINHIQVVVGAMRQKAQYLANNICGYYANPHNYSQWKLSIQQFISS